jgi:hypothetical protein
MLLVPGTREYINIGCLCEIFFFCIRPVPSTRLDVDATLGPSTKAACSRSLFLAAGASSPPSHSSVHIVRAIRFIFSVVFFFPFPYPKRRNVLFLCTGQSSLLIYMFLGGGDLFFVGVITLFGVGWVFYWRCVWYFWGVVFLVWVSGLLPSFLQNFGGIAFFSFIVHSVKSFFFSGFSFRIV